MKHFTLFLALLMGVALSTSAQMYVWHNGSTTHEIAIPVIDSLTFEDTDNPYSSLTDEQCLVYFPKRHVEVTIGSDEQLAPTKIQIARRTSAGSLTVAIQNDNADFIVPDSVHFADHETVTTIEISREKRAYYDAQVTLTIVDPRSHEQQTLSSKFTLTLYREYSNKRITALEAKMKELYAGVGHLGYQRHNDFGVPSAKMIVETNGQDFIGQNIGYNWFSQSLYPDNRDVSYNTTAGMANHIVYNTYFNIIDEANQIINSVSEQSADDWELLVCQAKTLRAFSYLELVQLYQKTYITNSQDLAIPLLLDDASVSKRFSAPKATVQAIYTQIIKDLDDACASNNKDFEYSYNHGVCKAVAYGLRARTNLIIHQYAAADLDARQCLDLSYATPLTIEECSKPGFADKDAHNVIWAIDINEDDDVVKSSITNWPSHLSSFYQDGYIGVGAYRSIASELYDKINDSDVRKGWWLDKNNESPLLDVAGYSAAKEKIQGAEIPHITTKFGTGDGTTSGLSAAAADWILMRAEEMHLIIAEAENSAAKLEAFVQTYRDPEYRLSGSVTNAVWDQRRIELWGEGFAFQDILRLQKDLVRSSSTNWPQAWVQDFNHNKTEWNILVWKFPQAEPIDTSHVDPEQVVPTIAQPEFWFLYPDSIVLTDKKEDSLKVEIYRYAMAEAYDLPIKIQTNDSSFFTLPSSVHFDKLQDRVEITISYANPQPGKTYDLYLSVSNAEVTKSKPYESHYQLHVAGENAIYFPNKSIHKEYDPADGVVSYKIPISRRDSVGELSVPIFIQRNDDDIFSVTDEVVFADGVATDSIYISFVGGKEGDLYTLVIYVSDAFVDPQSSDTSQCTFSFVNLPWQDAPSPAVWVDESWTGAFGMDPQIWYVNYQYVALSDGRSKFRFLNPYASHPSNWDKTTKSGTPDRYGVYDGFPANYPGDYDSIRTYHAVCSVTAEGKASWTRFNTGVDWSYGQFYIGNVCVDYSATEDDYPLGQLDNNIISFPKNSIYLYIPGYGAYPGGACTIYLDAEAYQKEHSVKHIADFEDGFNDQTEMQWTDQQYPTSFFQSEAFEIDSNKVLRKAVDIDSIHGEKSEFRNLWSIQDPYANGYCFAFYWDQEKDKITIPAEQPTGQVFAGKDIFAGPSGEKCTIETITISGTILTKITFAVALTTEEGGLIGEYEEVLYIGDKINWTIDAFCGSFDYAGTSAFDGTDVEASVTISKIDEDSLFIDGLHQYSSGIYGTFDEATKTVSIVPQLQDSVYGKYDIAFFTIDSTDNVSTTAPIILKANIDGSIALSAETEAIGWVLNSKAAGGMVAAVYGFDLTPAAPEVAPRASSPERHAPALTTKSSLQTMPTTPTTPTTHKSNLKLSSSDLK